MTTINDENIASKQLKIMFCLPGTTFSHNFLKKLDISHHVVFLQQYQNIHV